MDPLKDAPRLIELTRFLFACPSTLVLSLFMLLFSLLLTFFKPVVFSHLDYFALMFLPPFLASFVSFKLTKRLGGDLRLKGVFLLHAFSLLIFGVVATLAFSFLQTQTAVFLTYTFLSLLFCLNQFATFIIGAMPMRRAILPSLIYPLLVFATLGGITGAFPQPGNFVALLLVSQALAAFYIYLLNQPFKSAIGIRLMDLVSLTLREFMGLPVAENPFKDTGEKTEALYQTLQFNRKGKDVLLALPWLHPGPLGSIGGHLPTRLQDMLRNSGREPIFLHTYVDHSMDAIFLDSSVKKLVDVTRNLKKGFDKATHIVTMNKRGVTLAGQRFGSIYMFVSSFAPAMTEDVKPELGTQLLLRFNGKVLLVDAHNSTGPEEEEMTNIGLNDKRGRALLECVNELAAKLDNEKEHPIRVGAATIEKEEFSEVGIEGMSALVMQIGRQKALYVILNANNLAPGFREALLKKFKKKFNICEALTTDIHLGNFAMKMHGKIGTLRKKELLERIDEMAGEAVEDLSPATACFSHNHITTKVLGGDKFEQLIKLGNYIIPRAQAYLAGLLAAYASVAYFLYTL